LPFRQEEIAEPWLLWVDPGGKRENPKLRERLAYANVIPTLCLFLLLGGGAYAVTKRPKNSVSTMQLRRTR
jgi:hypothetical protein